MQFARIGDTMRAFYLEGPKIDDHETLYQKLDRALCNAD